MKRYWWVNHKQTVRQEIDGKYLWSPKTEANGVRSQFYDNMREAALGDFVFSYANGRIGYIGVVADYAITAPKPDEFGGVGKYWDNEGWLLPVFWSPAPNPVLPKPMIGEIAPMLPDKYSPISPETGNGNQKAYLTEISRELFDFLRTRLGFAADAFDAAVPEVAVVEALDDAIQGTILADDSLSQTEKGQLVKARKGQGIFRDRLCGIERGCRITGIDNPVLLVASHIKPWRSCASATERLDGANGLLLAPHVDRLFDRGFLTFKDDGQTLLSNRIAHSDLERLRLVEALEKGAGAFNGAQRAYLDYHRRNVFR